MLVVLFLGWMVGFVFGSAITNDYKSGVVIGLLTALFIGLFFGLIVNRKLKKKG